MCRHILILALLCGFARLGGAESAGVYALIIGPKYDSGLELAHTIVKAQAIQDLVKSTYSNAHIWPFIGPTATFENVRSCLINDVPKVPAYSLVIVYFVGHGERVTTPTGSRSDLFLLLSGSKPNRYLDTSIRINEIYDAIKGTPKCFAMTLLDCCFSGREDPFQVDFSEETLSRLGVRAFMLCSSSENEISVNGIFTDTVIDVLRQELTAGPRCPAPRDFAREVQSRLISKNEYMTTDFVYGRYIDSCMAELGRPSMLITLMPDRPPKYKLQVTLGGRSEPEIFETDREPIFIRSVPRRDISVVVKCQGMEIFNSTAKESAAVNDTVSLIIKVPKEFAQQIPEDRTRVANAVLETAKTIEAFGGNAGSTYLAAAREFVAAKPGYDTSALIAKVLQTAGVTSPEFKIAKIIAEKRPLTISSDNVQLANTIRAAGGYDVAATFDLGLARQTGGLQESSKLVKSAISSFQAAGDKSAIAAIRNDELLDKFGSTTRSDIKNFAHSTENATDEKFTIAARVDEPAPASSGKDAVTIASIPESHDATTGAVAAMAEANTQPIKYYYTPTTQVNTVDGKTLSPGDLRPGMSGTAYYIKEGDRRIVRRVIVTESFAAPITLESPHPVAPARPPSMLATPPPRP